MPSVWQALRRGESARDRKLQLERAYERFTDEFAGEPDPDLGARLVTALDLRPVVLESWMRAKARTLDPERVPGGAPLSEEELRELQRVHPIARALPVVHRLLLDEASESGFIVAIGDARGRLLWVDGDRRLRSRAEDFGFRAGTDWSEANVGTSAPGSALALDHAIQVMGAEHYNRRAHEWSCTAAPVHDPVSGAILGVIDVTGGDEAAAPHILPLVHATLAAVEAELKLEALRGRIESDRGARRRTGASGGGSAAQARLMLLGRDPAVLQQGAESIELSGRHAEILLALVLAPGGLSAAALAERVYGDLRAEVTLRAEVARLRKSLRRRGVEIEVRSRPYRLASDLQVDAIDVLEALGRGAHRLALAAYEGPVLPASNGPVVEELRDDVDTTLREAMLQSAGAETLFDYAQHWGGEDLEVWRTLLQVLPQLSPKRARVVAKLETLQR